MARYGNEFREGQTMKNTIKPFDHHESQITVESVANGTVFITVRGEDSRDSGVRLNELQVGLLKKALDTALHHRANNE